VSESVVAVVGCAYSVVHQFGQPRLTSNSVGREALILTPGISATRCPQRFVKPKRRAEQRREQRWSANSCTSSITNRKSREGSRRGRGPDRLELGQAAERWKPRAGPRQFFEEWSEWCSRLAVAIPSSGIDSVKADDPHRRQIVGLFEARNHHHGEFRIRAGDLAEPVRAIVDRRAALAGS
jgi:hypothetical protein